MYKSFFGIVILLVLSFSVSAQSSNESFKGNWKAWDNTLKMYEGSNGSLEGIFIDENGKQIQKEKVVTNLKKINGVWEGDLYSKKRNKSSKIECTLVSPDELEVKIIIARFFSKSFIWTKLED